MKLSIQKVLSVGVCSYLPGYSYVWRQIVIKMHMVLGARRVARLNQLFSKPISLHRLNLAWRKIKGLVREARLSPGSAKLPLPYPWKLSLLAKEYLLPKSPSDDFYRIKGVIAATVFALFAAKPVPPFNQYHLYFGTRDPGTQLNNEF